MKEKDFQRMFKKFVEVNKGHHDLLHQTTVWELKIAKTKSIGFDRVAPHQVTALQEVKAGGFYRKITDSPVSWGQDTKMRYTEKKPFDCMMIKTHRAFVVIWFYKPRQDKFMYWIDIDDFCYMVKTANRKSMTEDMAEESAAYIIQFDGEGRLIQYHSKFDEQYKKVT